ncbi:uncharacterized protein F4807DRAFT_456367 [Annulohypoxylon truncatum]|uniref:uncharacterized protein n=1 Tax=Annulohypoxylon truncatum TaxID=327061 RepID=UPI0020088399|nr:uncharacterized protein F4807DRAFT_456367 [Annulohypoxylon truncatum]KAI1213818.1 hypothetical protein F4807DRAFT_456367 [Annulohypoxylon truncatum]
MKSVNALLCLAGIAHGAIIKPVNFKGLGNGMYTVPLDQYDNMDISRATLDSFNVSAAAPDHLSVIASAEAQHSALMTSLHSGGAKDTSSGASSQHGGNFTTQCAPQFPTRKTFCRERAIDRTDYLRAFAKYLDWIENGPDAGVVPKHACKALMWGGVVVATCSWGGVNPTCVGELVEAMRELDTYCAYDEGGDIQIKHWKKRYTRHNIMDGVKEFAVAGEEGQGAEGDVAGEAEADRE